MNTPPPVDLSALKKILTNAKKIMHKVDNDNPIVNKNINTNVIAETDTSISPNYSEADEKELVYEQPTPKPQTGPKNYTAEQVMASNLPDSVKQLMIAKPIPQLQGPPSKFSVEDLDELVEKPKLVSPRIPIVEGLERNQHNMITVSVEQLQEMIKEGISNFFRDDYEKRLTESTIKKTINVLIKEGKINIKKKKI